MKRADQHQRLYWFLILGVIVALFVMSLQAVPGAAAALPHAASAVHALASQPQSGLCGMPIPC